METINAELNGNLVPQTIKDENLNMSNHSNNNDHEVKNKDNLKTLAKNSLKKRQCWGQNREWLGDYLSLCSDDSYKNSYNEIIETLRDSHPFKKVLFSSTVLKYNKLYQQNNRTIVLTENFIYKLDSAKNKFRYRRKSIPIPLKNLTSISVSTGRDQLIICHTNKTNDLIIILHNEIEPSEGDRIGELVGIICQRYFEICAKNIPVNVGAHLECFLNCKQHSLTIESVSGLDDDNFEHSGRNIKLEVPSSYCVPEETCNLRN